MQVNLFSATGLTPPAQTTTDLQRAGQAVTPARPPTPTTSTPPSVTPSWVYTACGVDTSALLPHPGQCQLYFDCSHTAGGPRESSCSSDKLFDSRKMACADFWTVDCGARTRPPSYSNAHTLHAHVHKDTHTQTHFLTKLLWQRHFIP